MELKNIFTYFKSASSTCMFMSEINIFFFVPDIVCLSYYNIATNLIACIVSNDKAHVCRIFVDYVCKFNSKNAYTI